MSTGYQKSQHSIICVKTVTGAEADGVVVDVNSLVSMNMWGLTPEFLDVLEQGFKEFFEKEVPGNPLKAEVNGRIRVPFYSLQVMP